jgi:LysR family transcriptional regulator, nitrogen assimilation regulatory protein
MDFRQSSYFIALVEEGSFTKAARRVHATQPGLSVLISNLEKEFGVKLVERHPRGTSVTAAGERLYDSCVSIMRAVENARIQMAEIKGAVMGKIAFGLPPTLCRGMATSVLSAFEHSFPFVELKLVEAFSRNLIDWVSARELDFAVVTKASKVRGLKHTFLHRDHLILISGRKSDFRDLEPIALSELSNLKLILPSRKQFLGDTIYQTIISRGVRVEKILEVDGLVSLIDMVSETDWVAFLPTIAVDPQSGKRPFTITPLSNAFIEFEYFLVESSTAPLSAPARLLVDLITNAFNASEEAWPTSIATPQRPSPKSKHVRNRSH